MAVNEKLVLIVPDMHFPHEDKGAVACVREVVRRLRPGRVVQLGDILDAGPFSSHDGISVEEARDYDFMGLEVDPAREFTDWCLKWGGRYIQLGGNHEYRVERFCLKHGVPGIAAYKAIAPSQLLGRGRDRKVWQYVPYVDAAAPMSYYSITRDLAAVHGWSYAKHAAQVHLDKARSRSVVFGHIHRKQLVSTRDPFTGRVVKAWCPGTLSELQPMYAVGGNPNDWSHGFSLVYVGRRSWTEYLITIENGRCVTPDGTEIGA